MHPLGQSRAFAVSHAIRIARSGRRRWSLPLLLALPLAVALLPALPPPVAGISPGMVGYPLPALPPDTVRLTLGEALEILEQRSPELAAARARSEEANATLRQARAFPNPSLFAEAENLGALEATSGFPGWEGVQGTVGVALPLHPGGLRGRTVDVAGAAVRVASVREERERVEESGALALALVRVEEAEARLAAARGEAEATGELHRVLAAQALEGRTALGDAARARLEWTRTRALVSRREGETALRSAEAARILGLEPGTVVGLELSASCPLPDADSGEWGTREDPWTGASHGQTPGQASGETPGQTPDPPWGPTPVSPLTERTRQQEAEEAVARARRIPTLVPQVGWRREAGVHALSVGVGVDLPLFDRRGGEVEAAAARTRAAREEERGIHAAWTSALHAQREVLAALAGAAGAFDGEWRRALDLTVSAAEAAFREGEGTLEALLQARRARLESLEELRSWQAEVRTARLALYGLEGRAPDERALCARVTGEEAP